MAQSFDDYLGNLKTYIERRREEKGIAYNTMSKDLGKARCYIRNLVAGVFIPSFEAVCEIADYLEIPIDTLIGRVGQGASIDNGREDRPLDVPWD